MAENKLIVKTPGTLSGRPRIDGHRIGVTDIWFSYLRALDKLAVPLILKDFPELTRKQVLEALRYARENMDELQQEIKEDREAYEKGDPIPPKPIQST
jgi:uncharacterized protein (DUF433 family)